jgi:hypothetical protein
MKKMPYMITIWEEEIGTDKGDFSKGSPSIYLLNPEVKIPPPIQVNQSGSLQRRIWIENFDVLQYI